MTPPTGRAIFPLLFGATPRPQISPKNFCLNKMLPVQDKTSQGVVPEGSLKYFMM